MGRHSPALGAGSAGAQGADVDQAPLSLPPTPSGWASVGGAGGREALGGWQKSSPCSSPRLSSPTHAAHRDSWHGAPRWGRQVTGDKGGPLSALQHRAQCRSPTPTGAVPPASPPSSMVWVPGAGEGSGNAAVTCPYCCHCRDGGHQGGGGSPGDSKDLCPVRLWAHSLGRRVSLLGAKARTDSAPEAP